MDDYKQYVSFEVPQHVAAAMRGLTPPGNPDDMILKGPDRIKMELALQEIASTPEGEKILRDAAAKGPEGKVHVLSNDGGYTHAYSSAIVLFGTDDGGFQYKVAGSDTRHDDFVQNVTIHELTHIRLEHGKRISGDEDNDGHSLSEEAEAVREANEYIAKYYDAPPRDENTAQIVTIGGTPQWDYNVTRLARALDTMTPEQVKAASPEVQSLHEFRNDPKRLQAQFVELEESGGLARGKDELLKVISDAPPEPIALKPQPQPAPLPAPGV
jgi:hypothetical protein